MLKDKITHQNTRQAVIAEKVTCLQNLFRNRLTRYSFFAKQTRLIIFVFHSKGIWETIE